MIDIGKQITAMRRARDMTQEQLATLIGVSAQTVSKWECGTTMPDILLLPVIAEIFETSIDALFGIEPKIRQNTLPVTDSQPPEAAYDMCLDLMWGDADATAEERRKNILKFRDHLMEDRTSQSMYLQPDYKGIIVDADMALVCRLTHEEQFKTLEFIEAARLLSALAKTDVRKIMQYQLTNNYRAFTAATAAAKCGMTEEAAENALSCLVQFGYTSYQLVEMPDEEKPLEVYRLYGEYKLMPTAVLLTLAARLADWKERYRGFNCP
jgi:transcriptional regulator with XRE-family HTH domain